ncbi:esterase-like activity of phytase family protein [Pseudooceanicola sp.]|uniref:esterase-like activity of phytase family protein n=1 Tax=Pseudooceanicola sp. TaxID=1914328 RepID=UPI00262DCA64|nr:esterase-like activity of phytase family protein [Pseudooceanicola sp.]MDF1854541.1 esterase-like activity of phytase family protein [Pseudooceanicola sp.]
MRPSLAVALIAACLSPGYSRAQPAELVGTLTLDGAAPDIGGLSGLELSEDGSGITALSDRAILFRGQIRREDGRPVAVTFEAPQPLASRRNGPLVFPLSDSEGLAVAPDGGLYVSFERIHRVTHYQRADGPGAPMPPPAQFGRFRWNGGMEALAIDANGALFALPEGGSQDRSLPVWRFAAGYWNQAFSLPKRDSFLPVGADFGPDGLFYLLERDYSVAGFRSRVRRFDLRGTEVAGEVTLLETASGTHDNLEGIAVWRDAAGAIRLTLVSDDNFWFFLASELVEYVLPLAPERQTD